MASKFTELAIDCADPGGLAQFWCSVLDCEVQDEDGGIVTIGSPMVPERKNHLGPVPPTLTFAHVPEGKTVKNRLAFGLTVALLSVLGMGLSPCAGTVFVMASDSCASAQTRFICTASGQHTVFWLPWGGLLTALVLALIGSGFTRHRPTAPDIAPACPGCCCSSDV